MARLDQLLARLKELNGSDLHLAAGVIPRLRLRGELTDAEGWAVQDDQAARELMREIVNAEQWQEFEVQRDLDFAHAIPAVGRFRVNYFVQQNGAAAVFRLIPEAILSVTELGLPPAISSLAQLEKGLVLVTGPTGSGKSTTLAALIDQINASHARHIVTIEDPVEFVHGNKRSVISHREIGRHAGGFGPALRSAVRQDADVVLVGELRDCETMGLAITAAEMGLLVFGTLHTNSAAKTIDRVIDAFPAEEQNQVRLSLSESLAAVISQLLLPSSDGKSRIAVHEILLRTSGLPNVIREGNTSMLQSLIQSGKSAGMQAMDDALFEAVSAKRVLPADAYAKAVNKARFEPLLSGTAQTAA
jgi:twitching motility protein PilT